MLEYLNIQTWKYPVPEELKEQYKGESFTQAQLYAIDNYRLNTLSSTLSFCITIGFLWIQGFALVDHIVRQITHYSILQGLLFFTFIMIGSAIIQLPFSLYSTFVIEEKYGFNKTTIATFIADKAKATIVGAILGGIIYTLLAYLFGLLGGYFWLAGWVVVSGFSIFIAAFYTTVLLPIFNKLSPLGSGLLRDNIEAYCSTVSFPLNNIMVMDGSKRSSKANAFFSGMGSQKSIVLYDTLVSTLDTAEITAVLAHEVGHYQKKHITQSMLLSVLQIGVLFLLFGAVAQIPILAQVLGATNQSFYLSLITFSLLYSPVSTIVALLMNIFSRKNEYEADNYATATFGAEPLISALKKLHVNQLSNPQPHPAFVFVHYSHPTLLQRIRAMRAMRG